MYRFSPLRKDSPYLPPSLQMHHPARRQQPNMFGAYGHPSPKRKAFMVKHLGLLLFPSGGPPHGCRRRFVPTIFLRQASGYINYLDWNVKQ